MRPLILTVDRYGVKRGRSFRTARQSLQKNKPANDTAERKEESGAGGHTITHHDTNAAAAIQNKQPL